MSWLHVLFYSLESIAQFRFYCSGLLPCADLEIFVRGGPILMGFFIDEGSGDPNTTILYVGHHRPASKKPLNGVSLVCR